MRHVEIQYTMHILHTLYYKIEHYSILYIIFYIILYIILYSILYIILYSIVYSTLYSIVYSILYSIVYSIVQQYTMFMLLMSMTVLTVQCHPCLVHPYLYRIQSKPYYKYILYIHIVYIYTYYIYTYYIYTQYMYTLSLILFLCLDQHVLYACVSASLVLAMTRGTHANNDHFPCFRPCVFIHPCCGISYIYHKKTNPHIRTQHTPL